MKKLLVFLFFFGCITSFSLAQELTPDMLVGEYEGKAEYVNEDSDNKSVDKKASLKIKKTGGDSLHFNLQVFDISVEAFLSITDKGIVIFFNETEDFGDGLLKITKVANYEGDKITSDEFGSFVNVLDLSFYRCISARGPINEDSYRYFHIEMKKK